MITVSSKVRFGGTWLRKCVKRCSGVGHGRERGDDRKLRTDGESCVMSLPPSPTRVPVSLCSVPDASTRSVVLHRPVKGRKYAWVFVLEVVL